MGKAYPQIQQNVGNRIRELREKRNHTQESLALKSGLDRTYINSVENGRRNISVQALEKIILALDYTFKSFFSCELFNTRGKSYRIELYKIQLTDGYIKNDKLNVRTCGIDFFPFGIVGGSTKNQRGIQILIEAVGLPQQPFSISRVSKENTLSRPVSFKCPTQTKN